MANSFEANVIVGSSAGRTRTCAEQPFTAEGWMGDKLFPFSGTIDIVRPAAGRVRAHGVTDDPSGGEEGSGPFTRHADDHDRVVGGPS